MECFSCGEKFIGQENYKKHLQSEKHKKNLQNTQERQGADSGNIVSSNSKDDGVINCQVCNESFNSLGSFQNHVTTPEHALKVMLKQATDNTGSKSSSSAIVNHQLNTSTCNAESTIEESILPELNDNVSYGRSTYNRSYGSCDICAKLFSGPEPYKQHLESQAHKKKIALLQNQSSIQEILRCEPCNKCFSGQVPYAQHMMSENHKKKLQNVQFAEKYLSEMGTSNSSVEKKDENRLWFCNICNIQCSGIAPYEQHMAGSTHWKNEKRMQIQNDFTKMNGGVTSLMQMSNHNNRGLSEKSENAPQIVNGSHQKDNSCDFVLPEKFNELVVSSDELGELIKIISPDQTIDFDKLDEPKDSENENMDKIKESEYDKGAESKKIQNGFDDGLKETEAYQTCKICNVTLYDKDSAAEHFESMEHVEKRWGKKI